MGRLKTRRAGRTSRSYLTYRALWPWVEWAVGREAERLRSERGAAARLLAVDLGCGSRPYADLFGGMQYLGLNLGAEDAEPDVIADATALPLRNGCADIVFCTQVIEHVPRPDRLLTEAHRVLRPAGALILTAPFFWPLHEEPHDYFRFTGHGLNRLLGDAGFEVDTLRPDCGSLTQVAVSCIELLPRVALPLVVLLNLVAPALQALSADRRSTLNYLAIGHK